MHNTATDAHASIISHAIRHGGVVTCDMLTASPPSIKIRLNTNDECTALIRHAMLASVRPRMNVVITSSVLLRHQETTVLVVLGMRDATPADAPAVLSPPASPTTHTTHAPHTPPARIKATPIADVCIRRGTRPDIQAELVFKGPPIPFNNGAGELITFIFQDHSAKIRCVAFSPQCYELDAKLHKGNTYRITGGRCKKADTRFGETSHEFEIILDATTCVEELKTI